MELEFILKAVRRYLPLVGLSVVLGVIAGQLMQPSSVPRFESTAVMHVVPSGDGAAGTASDRYVASQLVVLESPAIALRAAQLADVATFNPNAVSFTQIAGTDVVRIIAASGIPADAAKIANAYMDAYIERTSSTSSSTDNNPEQIDASLRDIEAQLEDVDRRIQWVMAPYVSPDGADSDEAIPTIEQVAPALATEREVLLEQYRRLLGERTTLEFSPETPTPSAVIQRAVPPSAPVPQSAGLVGIAIPLVVVMLGVGAATFLARSSRRVIDDTEVSEALELPFAGSVPRVRALRSGPFEHLDDMPSQFASVINELCVQAEAQATMNESLAVLVTGTQEVAGTTTLATAMAVRFGELGSRVVLVDLDFDHPDIAEHFAVDGDRFSALVRADVDAVERHLTPTSLPNVSVVGRRLGFGQSRPQRGELVTVLDKLSRVADVVLFDGGPMLAASAPAVLAHHSHAIVLAVPVWTQERAPLEVVSRQLELVKSRVMPVSMPKLQQRKRSGATERPVESIEPESADIVSQSAL